MNREEVEPKWVAQKAAMDALNDGTTPWSIGQSEPDPLWTPFKVWAERHLGQGYSLSVCEGDILDPTTSWTFTAFKAGAAFNGRLNDRPAGLDDDHKFKKYYLYSELL